MVRFQITLISERTKCILDVDDIIRLEKALKTIDLLVRDELIVDETDSSFNSKGEDI